MSSGYNLKTMIVPLCNKDSTNTVDCYSRDDIELSSLTSLCSKLSNQLVGGAEHCETVITISNYIIIRSKTNKPWTVTINLSNKLTIITKHTNSSITTPVSHVHLVSTVQGNITWAFELSSIRPFRAKFK